MQQQYGIPTTRLAQWRRHGTGPEYFTLGHRSIRYYPTDIDDWLTHQNQPGRARGNARRPGRPAGKNRGSNALIRWNG